MPGIPFPQLVDRFRGVLERIGATVLQEGDSSSRPGRLRIISPEKTTDCLLYLWTITGGGGGPDVRPAGERRIQVTSAERFSQELGVRTFIGGYSEEHDVYAFWDVLRHTRFSPKSPSFQVHTSTLERAGHSGVATQLRKMQTPEVVVSVQANFLLWYVHQGWALHYYGQAPSVVSDLTHHSPEMERSFIDSSLTPEEVERRQHLTETMATFREAKFRPSVLQAYRHRCAVCGLALRLVDATYIVPERHPKWQDDVTNGLGFCPLHLAAYEGGLMGVKSDFSTIVNPLSADRLIALHLGHGLDDFTANLPPKITIPAEVEVRPRPENLIIGLQARNWPPLLIG